MYKFPTLMTIDPVLEAIAGYEELSHHKDVENGYGFVMYNVAFAETFADPNSADSEEEAYRRHLRRECRGIKYDLETREIVSRPYHKFFNIGEKEETLPHRIDFTQPHVIMEKLDGSMLTPLLKRSTGDILWMTKRGVTGVADTALGFLGDNPNYELFCRDQIAVGLTPIFEWCTRKQRIVLDYGPEDRLVLTGIRNNLTGAYASYDEMTVLGELYGLDVVKILPYSVTDVDQFIKDARALEGEEGYIVRFDDGTMYKIKGEWYCGIHNAVDSLRFEKDVIRLVLSDALDDAKPFLVPSLLSAVDAFHQGLLEGVRATATDIYWYVMDAKIHYDTDKKSFAAAVKNGPFAHLSKYCFYAWDRNMELKDVVDQLISDVIAATGSSGNVQRARHLFGGIKWEDFIGGDFESSASD